MHQLALNLDTPPASDFSNAKKRAKRSNPATSHEAAAKVTESGTAAAHCAKCLAVVRANPGLTAVEIADAAGIDRHAASRRLPELRGKRLVKNGDVKVCNGSKHMTWWPV
jgi:CRP-like cAMP-binding protein